MSRNVNGADRAVLYGAGTYAETMLKKPSSFKNECRIVIKDFTPIIDGISEIRRFSIQ